AQGRRALATGDICLSYAALDGPVPQSGIQGRGLSSRPAREQIRGFLILLRGNVRPGTHRYRHARMDRPHGLPADRQDRSVLSWTDRKIAAKASVATT